MGRALQLTRQAADNAVGKQLQQAVAHTTTVLQRLCNKKRCTCNSANLTTRGGVRCDVPSSSGRSLHSGSRRLAAVPCARAVRAGHTIHDDAQSLRHRRAARRGWGLAALSVPLMMCALSFIAGTRGARGRLATSAWLALRSRLSFSSSALPQFRQAHGGYTEYRKHL